MKVQFAAIADSANQAIGGKLNLLGEFDVIWADRLPVVWPAMTYMAKLKCPPSEVGKHRLSLRVVNEDEHLIAGPLDLEAEIGGALFDGTDSSTPLIVPIFMAQFKKTGDYQFVLTCDDQEINRITLHVRAREEALRKKG